MSIFTNEELQDLRDQVVADADIPANVKSQLAGLDDEVFVDLYEAFTGNKTRTSDELKAILAGAFDKSIRANVQLWNTIQRVNGIAQSALGRDAYAPARVTALEDFTWRLFDNTPLPRDNSILLTIPGFDDPSNPNRGEWLAVHSAEVNE